MLKLTNQQLNQITNFRECYVEYPQITEIYSIFDRLMFNSTVGGEQESLLLTGDTGSGKTALINNYLQKFSVKKGRWEEMPVLNTRIPSRIKEQNTLERFLLDLDDVRSSRVRRTHREGSLTAGVIRTLTDKKVKLIIINEIQELIEFKDAEERQTIANTFKMISEEAKVSFVLVGMPYSSLLAEEPQWSSRLSWHRHLSYFHLFKNSEQHKGLIPDKLGKIHFAKFVAGLAGRMGFDDRPNLTCDEILLPLFAVCRGECRALKHFLSDALTNALSESKNTLDKEILEGTFSSRYPNEDNPFRCSLNQLNIRELRIGARYNKDAQFKEDKLIDRTFTDLLPIHMLLSKQPLKS
ncbi:TniB family NTP-binding protein [Celerinatantimonas sp. MCCC 1A17872]|uniref:TniB family NTP-binding protein n=1 Tax=Celerinatantimonas sp. MCCC 1A17872 TaxID=3177514 RepID=UPI0038C6B4CF